MRAGNAADHRARKAVFIAAIYAAMNELLSDAHKKSYGLVADVRGYGMLAAIDVHPDGAPGARGHALQKKLFDGGLHLKATGDCVIVAPPLIAEKTHVDTIVDILRGTLQTL